MVSGIRSINIIRTCQNQFLKHLCTHELTHNASVNDGTFIAMIVYIVEETLRSTVNCIIVEVFLLKIVLHYVPFENQPDDPLKKLSIFFYLSCQIGYFFRKFKIFKKKIMVQLLSILLF